MNENERTLLIKTLRRAAALARLLNARSVPMRRGTPDPTTGRSDSWRQVTSTQRIIGLAVLAVLSLAMDLGTSVAV